MGERPRLIGALTAAVVAGEAALALLRPRDGLTEPVPVLATGYFSPQEIGRARAYRRPQLALGLANSGVQLALLGLAQRRSQQVPRGGGVGRAFLEAAGSSVASSAATLPLRAVGRRRALRVGLATDSWSAWGSDLVKATAIGAVLSGAAAAGALAVARKWPDAWWLPAAGGLVATSTAGATLAPVLLDPIFNEFTPLGGEPRDAILGLAAEAGVKVGSVLSIDASRRTSAANAYVTGLGATKRVVLFDTLLDRYPPVERDLVIAHELGHVRHRDVPRSLAFLAMTAPASAYAAQQLAGVLDPRGVGAGRADSASLPALAIGFGLAAALTTQASLRLSRTVENRADTFSLKLRPKDVDAFIGFERRINLQNLGDPDPPRWLHKLLGTHPTTVERIGIAEALRR